MSKIFISAGEVSGDLHAANLVEAIQVQRPNTQFFGMGHRRMKEVGVNCVADLTPFSTIGILEPIRYIPRLYLEYRKLIKALKANPPDLAILVDFQGFHIILAKQLKKMNIPILYYIPPQEWMWGTIAGGKKVVDLVKNITCIFEPEAEFYQKLGAEVIYEGHPLLDVVKVHRSRSELCKDLHLNEQVQIIACFPGSRAQEIKLLTPTMVQAIHKLMEKHPNLVAIFSVSSPIYQKAIENWIKPLPKERTRCYAGLSYNLIANAEFSVTCSGTITLEHAVLEKPCIVGYKFGPFSYWVVKKRLQKCFEKDMKYASLPNFLAKKPIFPELLQSEYTAENIIRYCEKWLNDETQMKGIQHELRLVKGSLGKPGVIRRVAQKINQLFLSR